MIKLDRHDLDDATQEQELGFKIRLFLVHLWSCTKVTFQLSAGCTGR